MKQIIFILIGLLFIATGTLQAQKIEEFEVNGNVYCYISKYKTIYPKSNKIKVDKRCEYVYVKEKSNFKFHDLIRDVFDKKRIKDLAKINGMIHSEFICDSKGNILEVIYTLTNLSFSKKESETNISLKEIDSLTKKLLKFQYILESSCPDVKYFHISHMLKFEKI